MCTIEIIADVSTSKCTWITNSPYGKPHKYAKQNVRACKKAARRVRELGIEKPCHNADRQGPYSGSILIIECPICKDGAIQDAKKARAEAKWEAAKREREQAQNDWMQAQVIVMEFVSYR
jgi:hypothetical protein